jgi:hypothetical protein
MVLVKNCTNLKTLIYRSCNVNYLQLFVEHCSTTLTEISVSTHSDTVTHVPDLFTVEKLPNLKSITFDDFTSVIEKYTIVNVLKLKKLRPDIEIIYRKYIRDTGSFDIVVIEMEDKNTSKCCVVM